VKTVGKIRVENISRILNELGINVHINPVEKNYVDLIGWLGNKLYLVSEITNWRWGSYCDLKRKNSILKNLNLYDLYQRFNPKKWLIVSFSSAFRRWFSEFERCDIDIIEIGFQTLPIEFYKFYQEKDELFLQKPLNGETKKEVLEIISSHL